MSPERELPDDQVRDAELNPADDQVAASSAPVDDVAASEPVVEEDVQEETIPLAIQLEQAEARAAEYLDSLQRERAAFQNFKRRVERERDEQAQALSGMLLVKLLPVLDDFYRAMEAVPEGGRDQWFDGIALILRKLERFLQDEGVEEIPALGQPFDPNYHEAIGVDAGTDADSGTITAVLVRGYRQGERVLRPAMVRVAE